MARNKKKLKDKTLAFYDSNAARYASQTTQADLSPLYDRFLPIVSPRGRILDLGCGGGRDLRAFKSLGFDCVGVDPSEPLVKIASDYSGCEVMIARAQDITFINIFDAVWACASLLHLSRAEMPAALIRIREALKKDGVFFLSMQEGEGNSIDSDGRFFERYSAKELIALVSEAGLVVVDQWSTPDALPGREPIAWINLLAVNSKPTA